MVDPLTALLAAIPGLAKAGADIATASDEAKRNAQLIEFQKAIINANALIASVQQQNASLLRDKDDLENQIMCMKNWDAEKQRYALTPIWDRSVIFALKEIMSNGEPPHYLCPNCFNNNQKSILHPYETKDGYWGFSCPICPTKIQGPWCNASNPEYAPS